MNEKKISKDVPRREKNYHIQSRKNVRKPSREKETSYFHYLGFVYDFVEGELSLHFATEKEEAAVRSGEKKKKRSR